MYESSKQFCANIHFESFQSSIKASKNVRRNRLEIFTFVLPGVEHLGVNDKVVQCKDISCFLLHVARIEFNSPYSEDKEEDRMHTLLISLVKVRSAFYDDAGFLTIAEVRSTFNDDAGSLAFFADIYLPSYVLDFVFDLDADFVRARQKPHDIIIRRQLATGER